MLLIYCPHCGEHREEEFHCKGQSHIARPTDADSLSDKEWGEYMYFRTNPKGLSHEIWYHGIGCRKFFNVTRDTVTYEIKEVYKMDEMPSVTEKTAVTQG